MCGAVSAGRLTAVCWVPRVNVTCIGTSPAPANEAGSVKVAIAMKKLGLGKAAAEEKLNAAGGNLARALDTTNSRQSGRFRRPLTKTS